MVSLNYSRTRIMQYWIFYRQQRPFNNSADRHYAVARRIFFAARQYVATSFQAAVPKPSTSKTTSDLMAGAIAMIAAWFMKYWRRCGPYTVATMTNQCRWTTCGSQGGCFAKATFGHAMIVVDMALNEKTGGEKSILLAIRLHAGTG